MDGNSLKTLNTTLHKSLKAKQGEIQNLRSKQLQKFNQLANMGKLSAGLTHEIITPLTNIKINLSMISSDERIKDEVQTALIGVDQIDLLIQSFLRQIKNNCPNDYFDPNEEIKYALKILEYKIRKKNIQIRKNLCENELFGNKLNFHQVVINLLDNAIDSYEELEFLEKVPKIIQINSTQYRGIYILKIIDYGIGIDSKISKKIFEPFFTTKPLEEGTGLGLSISKELIEKGFSGNLDLESNKNPTTFRIKIPKK